MFSLPDCILWSTFITITTKSFQPTHTFIFRIYPIHWIKLRVDGISQLEFAEQDDSVDDIFQEDLFGHLWWGDDVDGGEGGVYGAPHPLHGDLAPQLLAFLILVFIVL